MDGKHLLASITGTVDQALLRRNAYLVTENRLLRPQLTGRIRLRDGERQALAVSGQQLGQQARKDVAQIVKPATMLGWHRTLVAPKFAGSQPRQSPDRPTIDPELAALLVRSAREHRSWGDDRIVGALANLSLIVSAQVVTGQGSFPAIRCLICPGPIMIWNSFSGRIALMTVAPRGVKWLPPVWS